jgi:succinate dehydrogenase flavin-adding protein (antitoxin of CptAB toxin-antitoxin module)
MDLAVSDKNILIKFIKDFVRVIDASNVKYIIVSGFVAIAHGRSRGTEDIDMIIEKLSEKEFSELHENLLNNGFECLQEDEAEEIYEYLDDNTSVRYVRKGEFLPEMELKFAKDKLDEYQLENRVKLPLTNMDFYFSSIENNIAFKEELLKSPKDIADAKHLRIIYENEIDEEEVKRIKELIDKYRL